MTMHMRITGLLCVAVLLTAVGCTQTTDTVVQTQRARNWLEADAEAISTAKEQDEPVILPNTHYAAGKFFESHGKIGKAIEQYQKATALNHDYAEAYTRLGILLGKTGNHEQAEAALRRAIELRPNSAALRNNLGYEYALQGRWSDSEAELRNAIRLKPDFARAYVNLGMALGKMRRFSEALEAFDAVLPEADAFYNVGLMMIAEKEYQQAADAFRYVLALNPEFAAAKKQLDRVEAALAVRSTPPPQMATVESEPKPVSPVASTGHPADTRAILTKAVTKVEAKSIDLDEPPQSAHVDSCVKIEDVEETETVSAISADASGVCAEKETVLAEREAADETAALIPHEEESGWCPADASDSDDEMCLEKIPASTWWVQAAEFLNSRPGVPGLGFDGETTPDQQSN